MIPEGGQSTQTTSPSVPSWQQGVHQSQVFQNHPSIKETVQEKLGPIQNHWHPRLPLLHAMTSPSILCSPPHVPCFPTQTSSTKPIPWLQPTSTPTNSGRWQTGV